MSYTTMYGVPESGEIESIYEYRNAHLFAPMIWDSLWKKYVYDEYLDTKYGEKKNYDLLSYFGNSNVEKLWKLAEDERVLQHERVSLISTYDRVMIKKIHFPLLIQSYSLMYAQIHNPRYRQCHLHQMMLDLIHLYNTDHEYIAICFCGTSVADDQWKVKEGDGEDVEYRHWDISKDEGHFFLFEEEFNFGEFHYVPDYGIKGIISQESEG